MIYSDVTETGGLYQCFRCSSEATVTIINENFHADSEAINQGYVVLFFILGFLGGAGIISAASFFMNSHYNPTPKISIPKSTIKIGFKAKVCYFIKAKWEMIKNLMKNMLEDPENKSLYYKFVNEHELLRMTCLRDPEKNSINLNLREFLNKVAVYVSVAFIFCGIDVSNAVKHNSCYFDGREGFTSSQASIEQGGQSIIELPKMNIKATALVWFLNFLILKSIGSLKAKVFNNMKKIEKTQKFMLYLFSLIIEVTWIIILISCIMAEKKITSTAEVPNKFSLYFETVAVVMAFNWFGWNNFIILAKPLIKKIFGKMKVYKVVPTMPTSPV